jgi:predicted RNA polymerase sigma factor
MTAFGEPVLLENQDRSLWDCGKILRGFALLARDAPSSWGPYRLQAMIAAEHARAENWKATDWRRIRGYYDFLLASDPSPIVELNRAVAVAYDEGLESGLRSVVFRPRRAVAPCKPRKRGPHRVRASYSANSERARTPLSEGKASRVKSTG